MRVTVLILALMLCLVAPTSAQQENNDNSDQIVHTVQAGDNLYRIALRYGVSMEEIAAANNMTISSTIYRGQELIIPGLNVPDDSEEVVNPLVASAPVTHTVQRGESLTLIARRYETTVTEILQANNIANANRIYPGQVLNIWSSVTPDVVERQAAPVVEAAPAPLAGNVNTTYTVQPGETLQGIATRFGTDWQTLAQMNNLPNANAIESGQQLVIPALNEQGGAVDMGIVSQVFYVPQPTITQGKQIIIDLSESRIYAFEDGVLVHTVLGSLGRAETPTVTGNYQVYRRVRAQTMSGPGYSLPNVEWVLYFYQGYAIHGTYWHSNWGQPMSHGCVNLPNAEAQWFFENFGEIGIPVLVQQ